MNRDVSRMLVVAGQVTLVIAGLVMNMGIIKMEKIDVEKIVIISIAVVATLLF
jgi:hypothetical protein